MKMEKESFYSFNKVMEDFGVFQEKFVDYIIQRWKEKNPSNTRILIGEVANNTVSFTCAAKKYLIDFEFIYRSVPVSEDRAIDAPFLMISLYSCPKNKYFENDGIQQIGEKYFINDRYQLLDMNQKMITSPIYPTEDILMARIRDAIAKEMQMAK
jgi:hypothetical protein